MGTVVRQISHASKLSDGRVKGGGRDNRVPLLRCLVTVNSQLSLLLVGGSVGVHVTFSLSASYSFDVL